MVLRSMCILVIVLEQFSVLFPIASRLILSALSCINNIRSVITNCLTGWINLPLIDYWCRLNYNVRNNNWSENQKKMFTGLLVTFGIWVFFDSVYLWQIIHTLSFITYLSEVFCVFVYNRCIVRQLNKHNQPGDETKRFPFLSKHMTHQLGFFLCVFPYMNFF